ncbi:MAG: M55 family metallopeptidase [Nocardioidaceae bacterium]
MKIFISCDMEGVAGIVDWSQCQPAGGPSYATGCALMLAEVNAAIEGAVEAGADAVVVNDSHGAMFNLDPAQLSRPASYLSGRHKPGYMMQGLDGSFDAVFFVGYHGSISGPSSALSHTYNPDVISGVRLGGHDVGESGINALVAAAYDVPIALITGDSVTLGEAVSFAPDCVGVAVKESVTRFSAHNLHPEDARELVRDGARQAVRAVRSGAIAPPRVDVPVELEVDLQTADMAELASWVKGVERSGQRSVAIGGDDQLAVFASFVALTYITRQAGGR